MIQQLIIFSRFVNRSGYRNNKHSEISSVWDITDTVPSSSLSLEVVHVGILRVLFHIKELHLSSSTMCNEMHFMSGFTCNSAGNCRLHLFIFYYTFPMTSTFSYNILFLGNRWLGIKTFLFIWKFIKS